MSIDLETYTGTLFYKEIEFSFVFYKEELRLIPPCEKQHKVHMWFMNPIENGVYTYGDPVYIEDEYLVGRCNENGQ